ncbi:MAG: hypothetical protein Q8R50_12710 [Sediminibacterium sp.]|nr:hypothetical protein [Sediminibacterium sp.]
MLRLIITAFTLFISYFSKSQSDKYLLSKYSYAINKKDIHRTNKIDVASGFFYRYKGDLFFITAYHAFTGKDVISGDDKNNTNIDSLWIILDRTNGLIKKYYIPDIKSIAANSPVFSFINKEDMYVYRIGYNFKYINSIETLNFRKKVSVIKYAISYGFPVNKVKSIYSPPIYYKGSIVKNPILLKDLKRIDSLNFILTPGNSEGASGSPVFFVCTNKGETKEWVEFAGVFIGYDPDNDYSLIVKGDYLLNKVISAYQKAHSTR